MWLLLGGLTLSVPASGLAQPQNESDMELAGEAVLQARTLLKEGKYLEGLAAYEMAYRLFPDPNYLFAIARIQTRLPGDRCPERVAAWERFLSACPDCTKRGEGKRALADTKHVCAKAAPPSADSAASGMVAAAVAKAKAHFVAKEYAKGAAAYELVFTMDPKPEYLFMAAKGLSKLPERCQEAVEAWDAYLATCTGQCTMVEEANINRERTVARCTPANTVSEDSGQRSAEQVSATIEPQRPAGNVALLAAIGSGLVLLQDTTERQNTNMELGLVYRPAFLSVLALDTSFLVGMESSALSARMGLLYEDGLLLRAGIQPFLDPSGFGVYGSAGYVAPITSRFAFRVEGTVVFLPGIFSDIKPVGMSMGVTYGF